MLMKPVAVDYTFGFTIPQIIMDIGYDVEPSKF